MQVRSDRRYPFAQPAREVWSAATSIDRYPTWWPWLLRFEATSFTTGAVWHCVVKPPLPYTVRLEITLDEVVDGHRARATVGGDVTGWAEITITDAAGGGAEARLVSDLAPTSRLLRVLALLARPAVRFGHDWVLDRGASQFAAAALPDVDPDPVA